MLCYCPKLPFIDKCAVSYHRTSNGSTLATAKSLEPSESHRPYLAQLFARVQRFVLSTPDSCNRHFLEPSYLEAKWYNSYKPVKCTAAGLFFRHLLPRFLSADFIGFRHNLSLIHAFELLNISDLWSCWKRTLGGTHPPTHMIFWRFPYGLNSFARPHIFFTIALKSDGCERSIFTVFYFQQPGTYPFYQSLLAGPINAPHAKDLFPQRADLKHLFGSVELALCRSVTQDSVPWRPARPCS